MRVRILKKIDNPSVVDEALGEWVSSAMALAGTTKSLAEELEAAGASINDVGIEWEKNPWELGRLIALSSIQAALQHEELKGEWVRLPDGARIKAVED